MLGFHGLEALGIQAEGDFMDLEARMLRGVCQGVPRCARVCQGVPAHKTVDGCP